MEPLKILVVDDEPAIRRLLAVLLRNRGHEVQEATDAEQALVLIRDDRPDALVLDGMLPGMTGFELCRELKEDPLTAGIRILLVTGIAHGLSPEAAQESCENVPADGFLGKPFQLQQFAAQVEKVLGTSGTVA